MSGLSLNFQGFLLSQEEGMTENETEKREAVPTNVLLTLCIKSQFLHLGTEDSNIGLYPHDKNEKTLFQVY